MKRPSLYALTTHHEGRTGNPLGPSGHKVVQGPERGTRESPSEEAQYRTRTDDPLLTMEVLYQLS